MRSYPDSGSAAGAKAGRAPAHEMPRWVKVFSVIAAIVVTVFAVLHLAGGGMGHIGHGNIGAHTMPAEQGQQMR